MYDIYTIEKEVGVLVCGGERERVMAATSVAVVVDERHPPRPRRLHPHFRDQREPTSLPSGVGTELEAMERPPPCRSIRPVVVPHGVP